MTDMRAVIIPKSDQINADDLIGGPMTITITQVAIQAGKEQPVSVFFEGDGGKPWKPCKSMSRVMVTFWGPDASKYAGQSLTLYRDPNVKWGGMAVGGIRISHMTGLKARQTIALTETKGKRTPHVVDPLKPADPAPVAVADPVPAPRTRASFLSDLERDLASALSSAEPQAAVDAILSRDDLQRAMDAFTNGAKTKLDSIIAEARNVLGKAHPPADAGNDFPGDAP
jgi:hypothetical protein